MNPLTAHDILHLWETGKSQNVPGQALSLLACACPDLTREELEDLSLSRRDELLLDLHERTFGPEMAGHEECPRCRERLEFSLSTRDFLDHSGLQQERSGDFLVTIEERTMRFRLPSSADLIAAAACGETESARLLLVRRCVLEAWCGQSPVAVPDLPAASVTRLAEHISACAPLTETVLDLHCPDCGHRWQALFDIATFLWTAILFQAKHLLREVHALATAYAWSEADILAMSPARREFYLEMANQ